MYIFVLSISTKQEYGRNEHCDKILNLAFIWEVVFSLCLLVFVVLVIDHVSLSQ